jgi:hypothetical protein
MKLSLAILIKNVTSYWTKEVIDGEVCFYSQAIGLTKK